MRSYLTEKQIRILRLLVQGLTIDDIARVLGTSRSNVYCLLRNARKVVDRSRNTLRIYEEIVNSGRSIVIAPQTSLDDLLREVLNRADRDGIKIRLTSAEMLLKILKTLRSLEPGCLDLDKLLIRCELTLSISDSDISIASIGSRVQ